MTRKFVPCLSLFILFFCSQSVRAEMSDVDSMAIRQVISSQLSAFQADDGETAFFFASPMIRGIFKTPDHFMSMVKQGYPAVYRPRSTEFLDIRESPRGPLQDVHVIGPDGVPVIARYMMEKQRDGAWKINGCEMIKRSTVGV